MGWSIQATQTADAGVIFASVGVSLSEGLPWTHGNNESFGASVATPAHQWGEVGVANIYAMARGTQKTVFRNCDIQTIRNIFAKFPIANNPGADFIVANTKTLPRKPPWPLSPK